MRFGRMAREGYRAMGGFEVLEQLELGLRF
jgi:hypothetical protein